MKFRHSAALVAIIGLLLMVSVASSAGPSFGIGTPTMRFRATSDPAVSEIRADGITNGGVAGNGAISWDIFVFVPNNVTAATMTLTPGPAWVAQCPGAFGTSKSPVSVPPPPPGKLGFLLSGYCTDTRTGPPVTGNDVQVVSIAFNSTACANGGFVVDMDGTAEYTDMFDTDPQGLPAYIFPDGSLTDGGACGNPTAITLSNVTASPVAPMGNALYLAAAGAVALLGAAGLALRGIRKH